MGEKSTNILCVYFCQEGKQASLAADFSVTQFKHLGRLLMVHGRNSYKRSAALSQFVIHRSLCISTMQVVFVCVFVCVAGEKSKPLPMFMNRSMFPERCFYSPVCDIIKNANLRAWDVLSLAKHWFTSCCDLPRLASDEHRYRKKALPCMNTFGYRGYISIIAGFNLFIHWPCKSKDLSFKFGTIYQKYRLVTVTSRR